MGWLQRLFGFKKPAASPQEAVAATVTNTTPAKPVFVILDVETTGLSPSTDRIIELALVGIDSRGSIVDEWTCRFNPEGPVGATHIHGITDADVADAPLFGDMSAEIMDRISGVPLAAHNASFDMSFVKAELRRSGWDVRWIPSYCTYRGSNHYLPRLDRRKLVDCCQAAGIKLTNAHSALGDARATAELLVHYFSLNRSLGADPALITAQQDAHSHEWPTVRSDSPHEMMKSAAQRRREYAQPPTPQAPARVWSPLTQTRLAREAIEEVRDSGLPEGSAHYIATLFATMANGLVTSEMAAEVNALGKACELTNDHLDSIFRAVNTVLIRRAREDGTVSRAEQKQLMQVAQQLGCPAEVVVELVTAAEHALYAELSENLKPLPKTWSLGEPVRVGDLVAFTNTDSQVRDRLEKRAQERGISVAPKITKKVALLVADEDSPTSKYSTAVRYGTRVVTPKEFTTMLTYRQPWQPPA